jgi:hypothetical protein
VFVGIPNLRDNDNYQRFFSKVVDKIKAQETNVNVFEPYKTPPYSGKFQQGMPNRLDAITDRLNHIVDKFLTTKATHLWIVDGDVEVPPKALDTLLRLDVDLSSGVYPFHNFKECNSMMFGRMDKNHPCGYFTPRDWDYLKDQVLGDEFPVAGGNGCMLIKRRVFGRYHARLKPLRFSRKGGCGCDTYFWKRVQEAGFTARVHGGVACGHLPEIPLKYFEETK